MTAGIELERTTRPSEPTRAGQLTEALREIGARAGDVVMLHVNAAAIGLDTSGDAAHATLLDAVRAAIGPDGTILVPTYTFSFCRQEDFDPATTPTAGGPWSPSADFLEYFRRLMEGEPG